MGNLHVGAGGGGGGGGGGGVAAAGMVAEPAAYTEAKRNLAAAGGAGQRLPSLSGDLDLLGADLDLPEMDDVLDGELALIGLGGDDGGLTFDGTARGPPLEIMCGCACGCVCPVLVLVAAAVAVSVCVCRCVGASG